MRTPWRGTACALALLGTLSACGGSETSTVPLPAARKPPCVADDGVLVGWLDGDAYPDRVTDRDQGRATTVEWGTSGGGFGKPVGIRSLIGARNKEDAAAVAADINGDDELDLVVVALTTPLYDEPEPARIKELRIGPLHRDGKSGHTLGLDLRGNGGLSLTDFNHDRRPDVAAWDYQGDGVYGVLRLLNTGKGLSRDGTYHENDEWGQHSPANLPRTPLNEFYSPCGSDGATTSPTPTS